MYNYRTTHLPNIGGHGSTLEQGTWLMQVNRMTLVEMGKWQIDRLEPSQIPSIPFCRIRAQERTTAKLMNVSLKNVTP